MADEIIPIDPNDLHPVHRMEYRRALKDGPQALARFYAKDRSREDLGGDSYVPDPDFVAFWKSMRGKRW